MKVVLLGIDGVPPELLFGKRGKLPNLDGILKESAYGPLETVVPALTIPAWSCMMTSKTPGELGVYGFRQRVGNGYNEFDIADSEKISEKNLWECLEEAGKRAGVIGVPPSFPLKPPKNGLMVSGLLTPGTESEFASPKELKEKLLKAHPDYLFDVYDFKEGRKAKALDELYEITRQNFSTLKRVIKEENCDFACMVTMGPDRLHHAFWSRDDPEHRDYAEEREFNGCMREYYSFLDAEIGALKDCLDGETVLIIASDHGAKCMKGSICVNEFLLNEGYLKLAGEPEGKTAFHKADVDWEATRAWAWGGYFVRLFINKKGREDQGIVEEEEFEALRDEIAEKIKGIKGPNGEQLDTRVFKPEEIYPTVKGSPADLFVYFDDLSWRGIADVGTKTLYDYSDEHGTNEANHSRQGIIIIHDPRNKKERRLEGASIYGVMPTVLALYGIKPPKGIQGKPIN